MTDVDRSSPTTSPSTAPVATPTRASTYPASRLPSATELAALIDALPRTRTSPAVRSGGVPRLERGTHRRRAGTSDRRTGRAVARRCCRGCATAPGSSAATLVERLAATLGVSDRQDKVAGYYHEMEQGLLPAAGRLGPGARGARADRRRDRRRRSARPDTRFGRPGEGPGDAPDCCVRPPRATPSQPAPRRRGATGTPEGEWDEVDELFRGG